MSSLHLSSLFKGVGDDACVCYTGAVAAAAGVAGIITYFTVYHSPAARNPFTTDTRLNKKPYESDQRKRDQIIKNGYSAKKLSSDYDAIVIGSGE